MSLSVSRERVLEALFSKLSRTTFRDVCGKTMFVSCSRRLQLWSDVPASQRPALFMTEHHETPTYRSENTPAVTTISVDVFVYIDASDRSRVPSTDLNSILDGIDAALAPGPGEQRQTLGGIVSHCRMEGQILKDPGDLDGDGLLIIPVTIMLT